MSEGIEIKRARHIPLTRGQFAIVDADDYEALSKYKWCVNWSGWGWRAARGTRKPRKRAIYMHRQITNCPQGLEVDHINHNTLDNRKSNLRVCTRSQNQQNGLKYKKRSSKYKGVWWYKPTKKWAARIGGNAGRIFLGYYDSEEEAAEAYDRAAIDKFGEFAYINFTGDTRNGKEKATD